MNLESLIRTTLKHIKYPLYLFLIGSVIIATILLV